MLGILEKMLKDVFISYAREDVELAKQLARSLNGYGYTVWWDDEIRAGKPFEHVINEALEGTRCVVVLWTENSFNSSWVKKEANAGAQRGMLVPLLLESGVLPDEFKHINATKVSDIDKNLGRILREVEVKIGPKRYELRRPISLPDQKEAPTGIAVSYQAIWTSIFIGDMRAQCYGELGNISGRIYRIDVSTGTVVSKLDVNPGFCNIIFASDTLWGLSEKIHREKRRRPIRRVDLNLSRIVASIDIGHKAWKLVSGSGLLWALCSGSEGAVVCIDPYGNRVIKSINVGFKLSDGIFGGDTLWVAGEKQLAAVNARSMKIEKQTRWDLVELFPRAKDDRKEQVLLDFEDFRFRVAWGADAVWIYGAKHIWKVDSSDLRLLQTFKVSLDHIHSFTCYNDLLWMSGLKHPDSWRYYVVGIDLWSSTPSQPLITTGHSLPLACGPGGVWGGTEEGLHEIKRVE